MAAGSSTRMGFDKLSFDLGGETVLHRSIRAFAQCPQVTELVLVAGKNRDFVAQQTADCPKPVQIVAGGATRAESAKNGVLEAHGELVAVHDAARPFVSAAVITAALEAAARCGAAAPAVPVKDTIKAAARGDGKTVPPDCAVQTTPDRSTLYAVQTPQCFDHAAYLAALAELDETRARLVTDDCSLFELTGRPVQLTQGDYANLKITTREDLPRPAQRKETEMRIGHGYDVHRLVEQRKLILGGVEIPFEKGLEIKSISREAGSRTKMAVYSSNPDVDAIGSCIGNKGARVNKIVEELGGEKIDIVLYSDDPEKYISAALSPASVCKVEITDEETKSCRATVPDGQLSLAIGNKGQNARLAARLTGWRIDIRPESGFYGEDEDDEPKSEEKSEDVLDLDESTEGETVVSDEAEE